MHHESARDTFAGIRLIDAPAFIVAQMLGAVAALYVFRLLTAEPQRRAEPARLHAE